MVSVLLSTHDRFISRFLFRWILNSIAADSMCSPSHELRHGTPEKEKENKFQLCVQGINAE